MSDPEFRRIITSGFGFHVVPGLLTQKSTQNAEIEEG